MHIDIFRRIRGGIGFNINLPQILVQLGEGELDRRIHRIGIHRRQLAVRNAPCHTELTVEHRFGQVQQNFILGRKQIQIASSCNARFVNDLTDRGIFISLLQKKTNAGGQDFLPCFAAASPQINHLYKSVGIRTNNNISRMQKQVVFEAFCVEL